MTRNVNQSAIVDSTSASGVASNPSRKNAPRLGSRSSARTTRRQSSVAREPVYVRLGPTLTPTSSASH